MSEHSSDQPVENVLSEALAGATDAPEILAAFRAFLGSPAYANNVDLAVLTSIAADKNVSPRERLKAAETLVRYRLKAMEALAQLEGVREQVLRALGIQAGPQVALTQHNTKIEIVRADDWRGAKPLEQDDVIESLPDVTQKPETNGHATNGSGNTT